MVDFPNFLGGAYRNRWGTRVVHSLPNVAWVRIQASMSYLGWERSFQINNCFNNLQKLQFDFTLGLP